MTTDRLSTQIFVGLIIIVVGGVLLLHNLGLMDASALFQWIPSLFVLLGVWILIRGGFRHWTGPLILIVGGGASQLVALDVISGVSFWQLIGPVILIVIGLSILLNRGREDGQRLTDTSERASVFAFFSGEERRSVSQSFRGADITAVFGGSSLDLREATLADPPATINVFAMFGGGELFVPAGWSLQNDVVALFGGTEDKRVSAPAPVGGAPDVIVTGLVLFGGFSFES